MGSSKYSNALLRAYDKDMTLVLNNTIHTQLYDIDETYRTHFDIWRAAKEENQLAKAKFHQNEMAKIVDKYGNDLKFKNVRANRDKLITSCLPLVKNIADKVYAVSRGNVDYMDLIGAGNLGLVVAAERYTTSAIPEGAKEAKFSTIAYLWIYKYIKSQSLQMMTPMGTNTDAKNMEQLDAYILRDNSRTVDSEGNESSVWSEVDKKKFSKFKDAVVAEQELEAFRKMSIKLFSVLSPYEKEILFMAFGINQKNLSQPGTIYTQKEIARKMGKSESVISRTIDKALQKLMLQHKEYADGKDILALAFSLQGIDLSQVEGWAS